MQKLPDSLRAGLLTVYSPKKFGGIVKCKCDEGKIYNIARDIARFTEGQMAGARPSWSSLERSPEEGKRRKQVGESMNKAKHILGDAFEYERSGLILKAPLERMRFDIEKSWKKKGWESVGMDWRETVENINSA